jgi:ribosomal protein S18 acetylase RimI-like enzyme
VEIKYTTQLLKLEDIDKLFNCLGWKDYLKLNQEQILKTMEQCFYVLYAYDEDRIVGTGRVVSDGVINAYICGLGIDPNYRNKGFGTEITKRLVEYCRIFNLHIQLCCIEEKVTFYQNLGFETFSIGMRVKEE